MTILSKAFFTFFVCMLLLTVVGAIPQIDIDIKPVFYQHESLTFNYSISSFQNENISYFAAVNCKDLPQKLLAMNELDLTAGQTFEEIYVYGLIEERYPSSNCTAYVQVMTPVQQMASKNFSIVTNPSFTFDLKICKDSGCNEPNKIFIKGDKVYLDYNSDTQNLNVNAKLGYPDGTSKVITLPYSFTSNKIGAYSLEVKASKEGYKNVSKSMQFGVIEQLAVIENVQTNSQTDNPVGVANESAVTDNSSNINPAENNKSSDNNLIVYLIIAGIVILIAILIVFFIIYKKNFGND